MKKSPTDTKDEEKRNCRGHAKQGADQGDNKLRDYFPAVIFGFLYGFFSVVFFLFLKGLM